METIGKCKHLGVDYSDFGCIDEDGYPEFFSYPCCENELCPKHNFHYYDMIIDTDECTPECTFFEKEVDE